MPAFSRWRKSPKMRPYPTPTYQSIQMCLRKVSATFLATSLLLVWGAVLQAAPVRTDHTQVELISETSSIAPGTSFSIGLRLAPDVGWHTYWINPGDAGKAAGVKWELPPGFEVGDLEFPTPGFVPFGPLMSYGYNETTLLIAEVSVPDEIDEEVLFAGRADWLVCDDEVCIPERAPIEILLPKGTGEINPDRRSEFAAARGAQPLPAPWPASYAVEGERIRFAIDLPAPLENLTDLYVFPVAEKLIDHVAEQQVSLGTERLVIETGTGPRVDRYDSTDLVLAFTSEGMRRQALWLSAARSDEDMAGVGSSTVDGGGSAGGVHALAVFQALVFAFLGGLLLNLMPCVLPILSLKALSLTELSASSPRIARLSGLFYTLGVVVSFLLLALLMIGLRNAGERVGWAFHLQNPHIVGALALVMFAVGMNFLGTFELKGSFANLGGLTGRLSEGGGGEFFTGALAVIVASPCTVPFMSPALGFALVQPAPISLTVFASLGLGFALPFLLMALLPKARALLPRPGRWMETFRHLLAFPMFATALWLLWVLGRQAGVDALSLMLAAMIGLGFALMSWGRIQARQGALRWSLSAAAGAAVALAGAYLASSLASLPASPAEASANQESVYSDDRLATLHDEGVPVFAYFTADWCITCKVNERVALQSETVQDYFENSGIEVLVGDWTNEDPSITSVLERHGRSGVPLYLYFKSSGNLESPLILPSLLTPDTIIDNIEQA